MALCIGCGLIVGEDGKLAVELRPDGGILCQNTGDADDGLYVDGLATDAELAVTTGLANTAQSTANTAVTNAAAAQTTANTAVSDAAAAQASANTALDRVAAKIRWGFASGVTNGAGDITFNHGLGNVPASVVLQPHSSLSTHVWDVVVQATDAAAVNVRFFNTTTGNPIVGLSAGFSWMAGL